MKRILKQYKLLYNIAYYIAIYIPNKVVFIYGYILRMINIDIKYKYSEIRKYKNIHKGERCFIICTGPSLNLDDLQLIKNEVSFSMNSIVLSYDKTDWRPTYYAIQDGGGYEKIKQYVTNAKMKTIFCGISNKRLTPNMECNYIPFPLDLGNHSKAGINHKTKFSDDVYKVVYDGHSITYSIIQLAVYMGFSEIYLMGIDCDYSNNGNDHIVEYPNPTKVNSTASYLMKSSFKIAKQYADTHNIKIYNATKGGKLDIFERVNLEDII